MLAEPSDSVVPAIPFIFILFDESTVWFAGKYFLKTTLIDAPVSNKSFNSLLL